MEERQWQLLAGAILCKDYDRYNIAIALKDIHNMYALSRHVHALLLGEKLQALSFCLQLQYRFEKDWSIISQNPNREREQHSSP